MASTHTICEQLRQNYPYSLKQIHRFSKSNRISPQEGIDSICCVVFRAIPVKHYKILTSELDKSIVPQINTEKSLFVCIIGCLQNRGNKDSIRAQKVWVAFIQSKKVLSTKATPLELEHRIQRALRSLPAPYHQGLLLKFSDETLEQCQQLEKENEALAVKLYDTIDQPGAKLLQHIEERKSSTIEQLEQASEEHGMLIIEKLKDLKFFQTDSPIDECMSEDLIPIYNRAAFFIPKEGNDKWTSWGSLLDQYQRLFPNQINSFFTHVLPSHPCHPLTQKLPIEDPLEMREELEGLTFRRFVLCQTISAIEIALALPLPDEAYQSLLASCSINESLRKNLSFYVTYIDQFVDEPIPPRKIGERTDRQHLLTIFRILYNLKRAYLPRNPPQNEELATLVGWVFNTNYQCISSMDKPGYARPPLDDEIVNPIIPSEVVPEVRRLLPLYKKNDELFAPNALTLFMIRPDHEYVNFLLECNDLPFAQITTKQAIEFSPLMDLGDLHERKMDVMRQVIPFLHKGLKKSSSHFFSIIPQGAVGAELREKVIRFNELLQKSDEEEVDSDLYFRALKLYLEGKIVDEHFQMFEVFDAGVPDLDLILYALVLDERTKYTEPRETDPPHLFRALHLLKPSWAKEIRNALNVYEERFLESHQLSKEGLQYIYLQVLSKIPNEIKNAHVDAVIGYLKQLSHHPFSREQHLHLFCEFIALQDRRMVLHQNIQLIASIESFIGHSMELEGVYLFLCYHPDFSDKAEEVEGIFQRLSFLRNHFLTQLSDSPFIDPKLVTEVDELHASMQHYLIDQNRYDEFCLAYGQVQEVIGHIQFQVSAANLFPYTTHLMRGFPKFIPVTERKNAPAAMRPIEFEEHTPSNALLPICEAVPIHKEIHTSWEPFEGGFFYRFSIITESKTYSGRARLHLPSETLKNEPALLSVIKDLSFFLANDTSDSSLDIGELNSHTSFDTLLASNPNAMKVWNAFSSPNKEDYTPAIFRFIIDLKIEHRHAYLSTTTDEIGKKEEASPIHLNLRAFLQQASQGNVWVIGENPTLLSPKHLSTNSPHYPFYSSGIEYPFDLLQQDHDMKIGELLITENGLDGLKLPLSFSSKPRHIHYSYQAEILREEVEKKEGYLSVGADVASKTIVLPGEKDTLELDGIEVTLSAVYKGQSISFTVTYPIGRLSTVQAFNHWMKWQEVMLKSRIFERIVTPHSGST